MDLMQLAKQFITDTNNDGQIDLNETISSISALLSAGRTSSGSTLDLGSLVSAMQGSGLTDLAASWLGDGENMPISGQQVNDVLGSDKINDFASALNIDANTAQNGLAKILPQLIDSSSNGGQLNDLFNAVGGLSGITEGLGKMFSNKT
jgi:uncharacterized protein YidB (DUF937 family)